MIDWLVENPEFFIAFFATLCVLLAYALWCGTAATLRKIDDAEQELDRSPHVTRIGNGNLYVLHPVGLFDQDRGGAA